MKITEFLAVFYFDPHDHTVKSCCDFQRNMWIQWDAFNFCCLLLPESAEIGTLFAKIVK